MHCVPRHSVVLPTIHLRLENSISAGLRRMRWKERLRRILQLGHCFLAQQTCFASEDKRYGFSSKLRVDDIHDLIDPGTGIDAFRKKKVLDAAAIASLTAGWLGFDPWRKSLFCLHILPFLRALWKL